jgi:hypothetical protein
MKSKFLFFFVLEFLIVQKNNKNGKNQCPEIHKTPNVLSFLFLSASLLLSKLLILNKSMPRDLDFIFSLGPQSSLALFFGFLFMNLEQGSIEFSGHGRDLCKPIKLVLIKQES